MMAANNETGVLGPLAHVESVCERTGALFLCDASQWVGRLPVSQLPRRAFVVGCAHKFGGPKGVGFVILPTGAEGFCSLRGGSQEHGHRGGTENLPAIASMLAALEFAETQTDCARAERVRWRDEFIAQMATRLAGSRINGLRTERLWNTVSFTLPAHENTRWVARLDRLGFQVSTGSACATGSGAPSHVLAAMGVPPSDARRTIRISSGWETGEADWKTLTEAMATVGSSLSGGPPTESRVIHL
jgi:cysteine desulfurase